LRLYSLIARQARQAVNNLVDSLPFFACCFSAFFSEPRSTPGNSAGCLIAVLPSRGSTLLEQFHFAKITAGCQRSSLARPAGFFAFRFLQVAFIVHDCASGSPRLHIQGGTDCDFFLSR
jgi:hypothetical protein